MVRALRARSAGAVERLADDFLSGGVEPAEAGAALYVAAALQVYFTTLAARLPAAELRLLVAENDPGAADCSRQRRS